MATIKNYTTSNGNKIKFWTTPLIEKEHVIVSDSSCGLERTYIVGNKQELNDYEIVLIKSKKQVIDAWINEEIHF